MLAVPWLLKPSSVRTFIAECEAAHDMGAAGVWLDHTWLATNLAFHELVGQLQTATGKSVR